MTKILESQFIAELQRARQLKADPPVLEPHIYNEAVGRVNAQHMEEHPEQREAVLEAQFYNGVRRGVAITKEEYQPLVDELLARVIRQRQEINELKAKYEIC